MQQRLSFTVPTCCPGNLFLTHPVEKKQSNVLCALMPIPHPDGLPLNNIERTLAQKALYDAPAPILGLKVSATASNQHLHVLGAVLPSGSAGPSPQRR